MSRSIVRKELWELLPLVALGSLVQLLTLATALHIPNLEFMVSRHSIPFVNDDVTVLLFFVAIAFGTLAGLWQTLGESVRGTWLFVLHQPGGRSAIIGSKLLVGGGLTLAIMGVPLAIYTLWAALPGTHPSPFRWSMIWWAWQFWLEGLTVYLTAFLVGLRPSQWYGSRLLPFASIVLVLVAMQSLGYLLQEAGPLVLAVVVAFNAMLVSVILRTARERDFS